MKLAQQVTSVKLSNKLHVLGVTTPSTFFREQTGAKENEIDQRPDEDGDNCLGNVNCYTVPELGKMLPKWFSSHLDVKSGEGDEGLGNVWISSQPMNDVENIEFQCAGTEADARAKMLIYLIEIGKTNPQ